MARYLITGIAGFIGSSLAHTLVALGHQVRGIDNLSTGTIANLTPVLKQIDFLQMDLSNLPRLRVACRGVDCIFHEAAIASVPRSIADPQASHEANINGTFNLLLAAHDASVPRVVFAASSSAYGNQPDSPKHESMLPSPLSPYATQKLTGEHYMQTFWHAYGLETVCLRYFNVFGPRQSAHSPYSGVIARFITDMLSNITPTIFGTGSQRRDFTYISDVVSANLLASQAPSGAVAGQTFNIGTGHSHTLSELYTCLAARLNFTRPARYSPARVGDILLSEADITKAQRAFGYAPACSFAQGIAETADWYLHQQQTPPSHEEVALTAAS